MIASSSSSPPMRMESAVTMPPREITATSVVPPPMSTTMLPAGSCTRGDGGLLDCPLLDTGDPRGDADDDPGLGEHPAFVHLLDEVAEHLLRDVEVGDDAVFQGPDGEDVAGGPADHPLGLRTDRQDGARLGVDGDDRGLVQHRAPAAD